MSKVLPIFPLYPSSTFLQYNVSLAIPGPKLWDLPQIGDFAKKNNYPNTKSSILIPDVEYIRRFANYELGISDSLLKSGQQENIARIKNPKIRETFDQLYGQSGSKTGIFKDGIGLPSIEKAILSSIFETQKPYFEIAQFVIKSLSKIEDIIARICPLIGAATNPALALAIKSRKPKGNGPLSGSLGPYGTPPALGYKNSEEVFKKLNNLSTLLQKGDGFKIDKNGKYTKVKKEFLNENNKLVESFDNKIFTYVTISTIYSTGIFEPTENYIYKYIDIDSDQELPEFKTPTESTEIDYSPDRIVLGIFNKNGTAIDPNSKVQYWGINYNGTELEKKESIFEKAPWIKNEKWIFDKSIDYRNTINWQTLDSPIYSWKKNGKILKQKDSPGDGWDKIKYKDVINFDKEENQYLKYLEDDFFVEFETSSINEYREYYLFLTKQSFDKNNVSAEDRVEILQQVEKLFSEKLPNDKIVEQLRNLIKYADFKSSYYNGIDSKDWSYNSTAPNDQLPNELRRIFKPMRFDIDGKIVWIDPEGDYDIKVIKIDPVLRLKYNDGIITTEDGKISANKALEKNSNIKTFVKNKFTIKIFSKSGNSLPFSIDVSRGDNLNTYNNLESYDLVNWNVYFDNTTGEKYETNLEFNFKVYFESNNLPSEIQKMINIPYLLSGRYYPDKDYSNNINNNYDSLSEDLSNRLKENGLIFLSEAVNDRIESTKLEKIDTGISRLSNSSNSFRVEKLTYKYWNKKVINKVLLDESISLGKSAIVAGILTPTGSSLLKKSIEKLDAGVYFYKYYTIETSTISSNLITLKTPNLGHIKLELINGFVNKWIIFELVVNNTTSIDGVNILPLFFKQNTLSINLGSSQEEGIDEIYIPSLTSSISISDLPRFQIELSESGSGIKLINSKDYDIKSILNKNLQELSTSDKLYSKGRYGAGWKGGPCFDNKNSPILDDKGNPIIEPDNPQFIGYNRRSQMTELDIEPYYIIEGYKKSKNEEDENKSNVGSSNSSASGGGFYRMPAAVGITKVMIELTIDLSVKLFPAINKLISLIKNPASFVTTIIQSKLEDHFMIFSPRVTDIISKVDNFRTNFKNANIDDKYSILEEMKKFVKSSEIGNYLYVDNDADFKFVIDGPALIGFFGILFGLDLNITNAFNGGVPIKPIFSNSPTNMNIDKFFNEFEINKNNDQNQKDDKLIKNIDLTKPDESIKNKIVSKNGEVEYYEEVTTTYSTGKFIKGVDYKYIYITQKIEQTIREADELINKTSEIDFSGTASNPLDSLQLASDKYQQAYDMIDKNDNSKDSLKKLLLDKIKALKSKINIVSQPLFKLILGIVTLPLKVVFSIIKWLVDFFKKLVNPIKFPGLIAEFLSFKWIMQFFTPKGILELAGIKFKPEKLMEWCTAVNVPNPLFGSVPNVSRYLIPDDYVIADLNEFLSVGFEAKLPVYTAKQYRDLCLRPFRIFNVFLCFIEKIINSFIMLIWSIMGITAVIPPPLIKLCKKIPENVDMRDLRDLVSGLFKDSELSVAKSDETTGSSYDFIYEVKLPDGSVRKDLDRESVQKLIEQNKGLDFDFLNFETLE